MYVTLIEMLHDPIAIEISWSSHTARRLLTEITGSVVAFGKQTLGELSRGINIRGIRFEYEIVPSRFQRFNYISAAILTVSNYNRKA